MMVLVIPLVVNLLAAPNEANSYTIITNLLSAEVALLHLCPQQNVFPWEKSHQRYIFFYFFFLLIFLESICWRHQSWPGETSVALSGFWNHPSRELARWEVELSWVWRFLGQEGAVLLLLPEFSSGTHGCFTSQGWDLETVRQEENLWDCRRSLTLAVKPSHKWIPGRSRRLSNAVSITLLRVQCCRTEPAVSKSNQVNKPELSDV